ncbi:MAG: transporter substrate-binding domain-containing protein [Candidatus Competibacter sp.]|nr:transporter substrate-binding domain-containing protein [Candidatus Competibacter sp.]MDG4584564.1 transporter substrate-binding domain-containing protein [Candidatus Competibacter sp.]
MKNAFPDRAAMARPMLCLLILLSWLAAAGARAAESPPALRFTTSEFPPLINQAHDGFLDRVILEAMRRAGIEAEIVLLPNARAIKSADEGEYDGNLVRIAGLERLFPHLIPVPEKIMDMVFVAFAPPGLTLHEGGWEIVRDRNVVLLRGWKLFEEGILAYHPRTAVTVTEPDQLFRMLHAGRAELALYELWSGRYLLKQLGLTDITVVEPPLTEREMFIYLHQRHAALAPRIAAALRAMKQDGSYQRLVDQLLEPLRGTGEGAP